MENGDPRQSLHRIADPSSLDERRGSELMLDRIRKLEEAVFHASANRPLPVAALSQQHAQNERLPFTRWTTFNYHAAQLSSEKLDSATDYLARVANQLPPLDEATLLLEHFAQTTHCTIRTLHMPRIRTMMGQMYHQVAFGQEEADVATLLLFTAIFAGAALAWNPELLQALRASETQVHAALTAYLDLAMSILDNPFTPVTPSTTALAAIDTISHVTTNTDGYRVKVAMLRTRSRLMAREMGVHRLDTAKQIEERSHGNEDIVDTEILRRIWWSMVATDWLSSFSGATQEGSYNFPPGHMKVNYPRNIDDDHLTDQQRRRNPPLSTFTSMTLFICRLNLAEVCRQVVDSMPDMFLDPELVSYSTVLEADGRFRMYLQNLPEYLQLDSQSMPKGRETAGRVFHLQSLGIHFSVQSRICHLHRLYHLQAMSSPRYEESRTLCIQSAQKVLELRRAMDRGQNQSFLSPAMSWTIKQHLFLAALTLAADASLHPEDAASEARREKVRSVYQTLQRSEVQSGAMMEGIGRNMQELLAALEKREPTASGSRVQDQEAVAQGNAQPAENFPPSHDTDFLDLGLQQGEVVNTASVDLDADWDQLLSDFLGKAPEFDDTEWDTFWGEIDV